MDSNAQQARNTTPLVALSVLFVVTVVGLIALFVRSASPPVQSVQPSTTSAPAVVQAVYDSGGLGISRADWERIHGTPGVLNQGGLATYENKKYMVLFWVDNVDNPAQLITRQYPDNDKLVLEVARTEARAMLPKDARFVKTITEPAILEVLPNVVDIYTSQSLISRYPPHDQFSLDWGETGPGSISLLYRFDANDWEMAAGYSIP